MKSTKTLVPGLILLLGSVSAEAQTQSQVQVPKLAGTECIRDVCLGDELSKFAPGTLVNRQATQVNAWGRKIPDVIKDMRPLYGRASEQTQIAIAQEQLRTLAPIVRIPVTPTIHQALVTDSVQVCGFASLWADMEGRGPEKWSLVFTALPGRKVEDRQAWVVTDITVEMSGALFAAEELKKLREDLAARASHPAVWAKASLGEQMLTVNMRWNPVEPYLVKDPSIGTLSEKTRLLFGCRSTDALPSF